MYFTDCEIKFINVYSNFFLAMSGSFLVQIGALVFAQKYEADRIGFWLQQNRLFSNLEQVNLTRGSTFRLSRTLEHDLQVLIEQKAADVMENRTNSIFSIFSFFLWNLNNFPIWEASWRKLFIKKDIVRNSRLYYQ